MTNSEYKVLTRRLSNQGITEGPEWYQFKVEYDLRQVAQQAQQQAELQCQQQQARQQADEAWRESVVFLLEANLNVSSSK